MSKKAVAKKDRYGMLFFSCPDCGKTVMYGSGCMNCNIPLQWWGLTDGKKEGKGRDQGRDSGDDAGRSGGAETADRGNGDNSSLPGNGPV